MMRTVVPVLAAILLALASPRPLQGATPVPTTPVAPSTAPVTRRVATMVLGPNFADPALVQALAAEAKAAGKDAAGYLAFCASRIPSSAGPIPVPQFMLGRKPVEIQNLVSAVKSTYGLSAQQTSAVFLGAVPNQSADQWSAYAAYVVQSVVSAFALAVRQSVWPVLSAVTVTVVAVIIVVTIVAVGILMTGGAVGAAAVAVVAAVASAVIPNSTVGNAAAVMAAVVAAVVAASGTAVITVLATALTILTQGGVPPGATMTVMKRDGAVDLAQAIQIMKQAPLGPGQAASVMKDVYQTGLDETAARLAAAGWSLTERADGLIAAFNPSNGELARVLKAGGAPAGDVAGVLKGKRAADVGAAALALKDAGYPADQSAAGLRTAGYGPGDVARAIRDKFALDRNALKSVLDAAGYSAAEVTQCLIEVFGAAPASPTSPRLKVR